MSVTLVSSDTPESHSKFHIDSTDTLHTLFIHKLTDEPYAGCDCISSFAQLPHIITPLMLIKHHHATAEHTPAFILIIDRVKQRIEIMTDHHSREVFCYNRSGLYSRRKCAGLNNLSFIFPGHTVLHVLKDNEYYLSLKNYLAFTEIVPSLPQALEMHFKSNDNFVLKFLEILKSVVYKQLDRHHKVRVLASGGIDSTLLAYICVEYNLKKSTLQIEFFNINFLKLAKDTVAFQTLCESPRIKKLLESNTAQITANIVSISEETFRNNLSHVKDLIAPCPSTIIMLNLGSILYHATRQADGSELDTPVISGLGPDEYCGAYAALKNGDTSTWKASVKRACEDLFERNIARESGIFPQIIYPYLEPAVAAFFDYLMEIERYDLLRNKRILRDAALLLGVPPELSNRPKQAAQFGSGCAKILKGEGYDTVSFSNSTIGTVKA